MHVLLCMWFLQPHDDSLKAVLMRPWDSFRRVLEPLEEHGEDTKSVVPTEHWERWFARLDEAVPFSAALCKQCLGPRFLANLPILTL